MRCFYLYCVNLEPYNHMARLNHFGISFHSTSNPSNLLSLHYIALYCIVWCYFLSQTHKQIDPMSLIYQEWFYIATIKVWKSNFILLSLIWVSNMPMVPFVVPMLDAVPWWKPSRWVTNPHMRQLRERQREREKLNSRTKNALYTWWSNDIHKSCL